MPKSMTANGKDRSKNNNRTNVMVANKMLSKDIPMECFCLNLNKAI